MSSTTEDGTDLGRSLISSTAYKESTSNAGYGRKRKRGKERKYTTYTYDDLPHTPGAIRILKLYSSESPDADILCKLIIPADKERMQFEYEALSWCWGSAEQTDYIRIQHDQKTYKKYVSPDLVAALKALRHEDKDRHLWIDMVCINQDNLDEKNHQVEMMHAIYGNAERVCIWLGEADTSSKIALDFIRNEISRLHSFDTLVESPNASTKWKALLDLMQRPWFSRRWVVQELALAQNAIIYCGRGRISWKKFAIAVELLVEVETATHRLSEVMKKDRQYQYIPSYFEFVSALGASLLVDANERLFRDHQDSVTTVSEEHLLQNLDANSTSGSSSEASDSDDSLDSRQGLFRISKPLSRPRNRIQPLLSLEYLVSSLTIFDTSQPHDTIYALLAIAKDTTPRAVEQQSHGARRGVHSELEIYTQRKTYNVDYNSPYVDVCKEFIMFAIERSAKTGRSRALDVICRPWAIDERRLKASRERERQAKIKKDKDERRKAERENRRKRHKDGTTSYEQPNRTQANGTPESSRQNDDALGDKFTNIEDMPLPSWVPQLSGAPHAMAPRPGHAGPKMSRINADSLVGLPSLTQRNYAAVENKAVDMKALRFRKRAKFDHFSMYVRGFVLDHVRDIEQVARNGQIPREWSELAGWDDIKRPPPDSFWRTIVANRGKDGKNPPVYYSRACEKSFRRGGLESGAVDTTALIEYERNSVVAQFCRRVQAVTWNRALIKTASGRLGLVRRDVEKDDLVCILYGCSVPVILRKSEKKAEHVFMNELEHEISYIQKKVVQNCKRFLHRKQRHEHHKQLGKIQLCRTWLKGSSWLSKKWYPDTDIERFCGKRPEEFHEDFMKFIKEAIEAYNIWRFERLEKAWMKHLDKLQADAKEAANDAQANIVENSQSSSSHLEASQQSEPQTCDAPETQDSGLHTLSQGLEGRLQPFTAAIAPGANTRDFSKENKAGNKDSADVDWQAFEYALKAGRRWRWLVREQKRDRETFARKAAETEWYSKRRNEYEAFAKARKAVNRWEGPELSVTRSAVQSDSTEADQAPAQDALLRPLPCEIKPSWSIERKRSILEEDDKRDYNEKIRLNLRRRLGPEGYYSYRLFGECYIHGMMDGEAMRYQNEHQIPSTVFEIR